MPRYTLFIFALFFAMARSAPVLAIELESPPVVACLERQGKDLEIQTQLVALDAVLFNWKMTQGDIIRLTNAYGQDEISQDEFEAQFQSLGERFSELTGLLNEETDRLGQLATEEHQAISSLSEAILAQKTAALLYMRTIFGMGNNEVTAEEATSQYDTTWADFVGQWNLAYSSYGCTSPTPWF